MKWIYRFYIVLSTKSELKWRGAIFLKHRRLFLLCSLNAHQIITHITVFFPSQTTKMSGKKKMRLKSKAEKNENFPSKANFLLFVLHLRSFVRLTFCMSFTLVSMCVSLSGLGDWIFKIWLAFVYIIRIFVCLFICALVVKFVSYQAFTVWSVIYFDTSTRRQSLHRRICKATMTEFNQMR